jgi:CSLREA domain-containing protein
MTAVSNRSLKLAVNSMRESRRCRTEVCLAFLWFLPSDKGCGDGRAVLLCFMKRALFGALIFSCLFAAPLALQGAIITVNSNADAGGACLGTTCTLRQAIVAAVPGDTIDFAAGITAITLTSAELLIDKNLTITGPGPQSLTIQRSTVSGTPTFRIFDVTGSSVAISGMTIARGIQINSSGGGISNGNGILTVMDCAIVNHGATLNALGGGGIFNSGSGTVNLVRCTLASNSAGGGGGILNSNGGTVNITDSTLSANHGSNNGVVDGGGITIPAGAR